MFWFLCVISAFAYSVQQTFMTHYIRKMDPFSVAMYRTLSLGISMSPLLLFSTIPEILEIKNYLGILALSALFGGLALSMAFTMVNHLPIGIASAISSGARVMIMLILGALFFKEYLSLPMLFLIFIILFGNFFLGFSAKKDKKNKHLKKFTLIRGSLYVLVQGALVATSFMIMSNVARQMSPLVVAYAWETLIGLSLFCVGILRWTFLKIPLEKISLKQFFNILWICSPTLVGTGAFTLAVNRGPIGIAGAIGVSSIIFVTILAYLFYNEKLSKNETLAIFIVVIGIIGIKLLDSF